MEEAGEEVFKYYSPHAIQILLILVAREVKVWDCSIMKYITTLKYSRETTKTIYLF